MKKNLFLWAAFAVMMALAGCTQTEIVYVEKENGTELLPGEGILTISLSGATTRAARPIDHFDPSEMIIGETASGGNNVNRIGFRIYQNGTTTQVADVKVSSWNGTEISDENETDLNSYILNVNDGMEASQSYQLKLSGLKEGRYNIIAYGYNASDDNTPYTIEDCPGEIYLKATVNEDDKFYEELFAGSIDASVNQYGNFIQEYTLTLERQVAGMLVYLENIPAYVDTVQVASVTISTIEKITGFYFPASLYADEEPTKNEYWNGTGGTFLVTDLLTFTLNNSDVVSNYKTAEYGDTYQFNGETGKKFLLPDEMDADVKESLQENVICRPNTLFGSCFLLPYPGSDTYRDFNDKWGQRNALHIILKGESGTTLKIINLKEFSSEGSEIFYNIKRNHFYSLGTKTMAKPDGNNEPDDDDKDTDDPLDINTDAGVQYVLLKINDAWYADHELKPDSGN